MFSGGMDSTYLAWRLLKCKTPYLHLHHVSIRNKYGLWKKQDEMVKPILSCFKKEGFNFSYSESVFGFPDWSQVGFDSDLLLLIAQKLAQNFVGKKVELLMGWLPSDMERLVIADRAKRHVTSNIWKALIESAGNRQDIDNNIYFPLIEANISKSKIIQEMPKDLMDLTWSCRHPTKDGRTCGWCHSCLEIKKAYEKIG